MKRLLWKLGLVPWREHMAILGDTTMKAVRAEQDSYQRGLAEGEEKGRRQATTEKALALLRESAYRAKIAGKFEPTVKDGVIEGLGYVTVALVGGVLFVCNGLSTSREGQAFKKDGKMMSDEGLASRGMAVLPVVWRAPFARVFVENGERP